MELVEKLDAIEACKQLRARYFRLIDTKKFDELYEVFTEDASFDSTEAPPSEDGGKVDGMGEAEVWHGVDMIVDKIRSSIIPEMICSHMGHTCELKVTSDTTAEGIHPFHDRILIPGAVTMHGYAYYYDTYEKVEGEWKIKSTKIHWLRLITSE